MKGNRLNRVDHEPNEETRINGKSKEKYSSVKCLWDFRVNKVTFTIIISR